MLVSPVISKGRPRIRKRTDLLLAVLLTALGAAVLAIAMLAATVQKQHETIKGLREQVDGITASHSLRYFANHGGNLPIVASSRKALAGTGFILSIGNLSTDSLSLTVELENPDSSRRKTSQIVVEPRHTAEFSHFDDWRLSAGDIAEISHEDFNSVTMRFR